MGTNSQQTKYVQGVIPLANAFAGTVYTDIINVKNYSHVEFIRVHGVGTTGTSTVTIEASDDVAGSNVSAVPFRYREVGAGTDVYGALTDATSTGFTTTAGSNQIAVIEVDAEALGASGYQFIRAKFVEVAASAVLGLVLVRLSGARYAKSTDVTAIS